MSDSADNVIFFPERPNRALEAFNDFTDVIATDREITDMDLAEVLLELRSFHDFCLASDEKLSRLCLMLRGLDR